MSIFNVDGVADIESSWIKFGKFMDNRKNRNTAYESSKNDWNYTAMIGVDLNRNFGVNFGLEGATTNVCSN